MDRRLRRPAIAMTVFSSSNQTSVCLSTASILGRTADEKIDRRRRINR